jgi:hypothetical protein
MLAFLSVVAVFVWSPLAAATTSKFALAMMHFNVQYVAGGLVGFSPDARFDRTAEQVEDAIIVESFEPILDLFLDHPGWGQDMELQGYMLDVIAQRHPRVLEKMRKLANSGQVDFVSFHYSDQLFLAYPRLDWDRSAALNLETFRRLGVRLSDAVFCQEGQAGLGMTGAMKDNGYRVLVWPKNLFSYQHETLTPAPLYQVGDVYIVTTNDAKVTIGNDEIDMTWTFVDDGELLATNDNNPYLPDTFVRTEKAVRAYEDKLTKLEADGYRVTTVSKYVQSLYQMLGPAAPPPPLLDGTWQPKSTDGTQRWMGGRGIWMNDERDNDVRTLGAIAHRELLAAETIAKSARIDARDELAAAWRLVALGQVTDATGINPFRGEVEYGIAHLSEALRIARGVIGRAKEALGAPSVAIDTEAGSVNAEAPAASVAPRTIATGPIEATIKTDGRNARVVWSEIEPGHWTATVEIDPGDGFASVRFSGALDDLVYTPGLTNGPVHARRDAFTFDHFYLPLSDGLIGLGGGTFLVKDQAFVHLAARIQPKNGDVTFTDEALPGAERHTWKFHVFRGDEAVAARFARRLNVTPKVWR